jgi:hypothetical protein
MQREEDYSFLIILCFPDIIAVSMRGIALQEFIDWLTKNKKGDE